MIKARAQPLCVYVFSMNIFMKNDLHGSSKWVNNNFLDIFPFFVYESSELAFYELFLSSYDLT